MLISIKHFTSIAHNAQSGKCLYVKWYPLTYAKKTRHTERHVCLNLRIAYATEYHDKIYFYAIIIYCGDSWGIKLNIYVIYEGSYLCLIPDVSTIQIFYRYFSTWSPLRLIHFGHGCVSILSLLSLCEKVFF